MPCIRSNNYLILLHNCMRYRHSRMSRVVDSIDMMSLFQVQRKRAALVCLPARHSAHSALPDSTKKTLFSKRKNSNFMSHQTSG